MSLKLDRLAWKPFVLGDVVANVNDYFDPARDGVLPYVAGPHIHPGDAMVSGYGSTDDDEFPPTFKRKFRKGDVLLHSRGIDKLASVDRHGVTGEKLFVLRSKNEDALAQSFLVWMLRSPEAQAHMRKNFTGSVNKFLNWRPLGSMKVVLPPVDEQKRIADLLWACELHQRALEAEIVRLAVAEATWTSRVFDTLSWSLPLSAVIRADRPLCYGVVQPGVDAERGIGLIRVLDLESGAPKLGSLKRVAPQIDAQYRRSRVRAGDVLLSIVGTIGRAWVVTEEFSECNIARALARISPDPSVMRPEFLHWVLSSAEMQKILLVEAFESARKTLNLSALSKVSASKAPPYGPGPAPQRADALPRGDRQGPGRGRKPVRLAIRPGLRRVWREVVALFDEANSVRDFSTRSR